MTFCSNEGNNRTLVVIPAFNEEESLSHTVTELLSYMDKFKNQGFDFDYIVVNDGSSDATLSICRQNGYPALDLPVNVGLTAGFQAGMKYAYRNDYDFVIQFDADGQHKPEYLQEMVKVALEKEADIVIGSRFVTEKKPVSMRMLGSVIVSAMIKLTSGKRVSDPTSGLRLFDRKMIESFATDNNFAPEPDTIAFVLRKGAKVEEVQVEMRERFAGESYLTAIRSMSYMMRMGLSILLLQWVRK
ncbi:MAG: glycosyltransferase family 2 protein [Anaerotardibacter sp.]